MSTTERTTDNNRAAKKAKIGPRQSGRIHQTGGSDGRNDREQSEPEERAAADREAVWRRLDHGARGAIGTASKAFRRAVCRWTWRMGGQGIPRGRIVEIFGPESSGKTTLALHVIAQAQKLDGVAAFIDAEHAFDPDVGQEAGCPARDAAGQPAEQR